MLRRIIRFCVFVLYAACSIGLLAVLIKLFTNSKDIFSFGFIVVEILGLLVGLAELYLLHRNREKELVDAVDTRTHIYVFIGDESIETVRISLLSLKHLRGSPEVSVICSNDRSDIEAICREFEFRYSSKPLEFDDACEHYLFTNGHTIIYPDAILVGSRRLGKKMSYVELNHSVYSSHALGNNNVGNDSSRASLLSSCTGSFSVPLYTGGPILVAHKYCNLENLYNNDGQAPTFAEVIANSISTGQKGTITSHPCCECMSHNEIDHNISSRSARIRVSRLLHKHPKYVDTATGIVRRYVGWYYMRYFWLRSLSFILAGVLTLASAFVDLPKAIFSYQIVGLFLGAQISSFILSRLRGDRRRPIERLRDSVLDCEAFIHVVAVRTKKFEIISQYRIRFVPFYLCLMTIGIIFRLFNTPSNSSIFDSSFQTNFLTLMAGGFIIVTLYRAMFRYLSARQRAFARRNVSITGSSSYESMWIVDLTHRGAAYISDSRLELGDETPLVFRIPTMNGDSLITVVGRVTYCAPRGDQYQVGVAFKELSQQSLDDLTLYCSIIYPYHQARNIVEVENSTLSIEKIYNQNRDPRRNLLSFSLYSFVVALVLALAFSVVPAQSLHGDSSNSIDSQNLKGASNISSVENSGKYNFSSLTSSSDSKNLVSITSSIFRDENNDGIQQINEIGESGVKVSLFHSDGVQVLAGADGVLGNADDGASPITTNVSGEYTFRLIDSGKYFLRIEGVPGKYQVSDGSLINSRLLPTVNGYRTGMFDVNDRTNGNLKNLAIGLLEKFDLAIAHEILSNNAGGTVPGDTVNIRVTVRNNGPGSAKSGYRIRTELGDDFDEESVKMISTSGFAPCGFNGEVVECVSTGAISSGESKTIEFSLISNASTSAASARRYVKSIVERSALDHSEYRENFLEINNNVDGVISVGQSTSVGDRVFFDANSNGILDSGEPGIEGVRIGLKQFNDKNGDGIQDPGETPEIAHDISDQNGFFGVSNGKLNFQNLTPNAQYSLTFSKIPKHMSVAKLKVGGEFGQNNNDFDPVLKATPWFTLLGGEVNTGIDLGLVLPPTSISNTVFVDLNHNAKQDKNEQGLAGQDLALFRWIDSNKNGKQDPGEFEESPVSTTVTSGNGKFDFFNITDSIFPTYYSVRLDASEGYDLKDSFKVKGESDSSQRLSTPPMLANKFNNSRPLAMVEKGALVEGALWGDFDLNGIFDQGERGVANLKVMLIPVKKGEILTAKSKRDGRYQFSKVASGKYFLGFEISSIPKGFVIGGLNSKKDADGVSVNTDFSIDVQANKTLFVRDLAILPGNSISRIRYENEHGSSDLLNNSESSSIFIQLKSGHWSKIQLTKEQNRNVWNVALTVVMVCAFGVFFTLARRRKLIYRNN